MTLSMTTTDPTAWLVKPPLVMSIPTAQLLMAIAVKVHSQLKFMTMAVPQPLNTILLLVNC
jgi:hypothetical protein